MSLIGNIKHKIKASVIRILPDFLVLSRGTRQNRLVALTFDDGPYKNNTAVILRILDQKKIKATFFMCGKDIENDPRTVRMVLERGHDIGCHLYSHKPVTALSYTELKDELDRWESLMERTAPGLRGKKLLRPPQGILDFKTFWFAWKYKWHIILWSFDTREFDPMSYEDNIRLIDAQPMEPGTIILLHDDAEHYDRRLQWLIDKIEGLDLSCDSISSGFIRERQV